MDDRTVLAVGCSPDDAETVEAKLGDAGVDARVTLLEEFGTLYDELCYGEVHALLLASALNGTSVGDVAHGVNGFYPDLPIVVAGDPDEEEGLPATVVEADSTTGGPVVDALASALEGPVDSAAARPPSRIETMAHSMFDGFPVHLYAKDDEARHLMVSRHANEPTDLMGITDLEYEELPEEHRQAAYSDEMAVIQNEEERLNIEEYTDYIDSHTLTSKVPWYGPDGDVVGLVGITQDITERKQREHASRRQHELLVKLALVAAHELRNALQVSVGRLELTDAEDEHLAVVEESQERLSTIVDTVVDLASEEHVDPEPKDIWLSTLSREVWDTLDTEDATLRTAFDGLFRADPESTSLLLQILFSNALEHAGPEVTVTVGATDDGFFVADTGEGIALDPPERAFDAGVTTLEDGTGFGLYVARRIVTEHEWNVEISEGASGGARFDVSGIERIE